MADFRQLISDSKPVFIAFFSGIYPENMINSINKSVVKTFEQEIQVIKINLDKNPILVKKLFINHLPTFMFYKEETLLWRKSGIISKAEIKKVISTLK